jgi:hypothetical protein
VFDLISEFTRRTLTYPRDRLNAFLGVLKEFEIKHNVRHLWGIPVLPQRRSHQDESVFGRTGGQYSVVLFLEFLISWLRKNGESGERQTEFPSVSLIFTKLLVLLNMDFLNSCRLGATM